MPGDRHVTMHFRTPLFVFVALPWGVACTFALAMGISADGWWQVPLFLGGAAALYATWRKFAWPDSWSRFLSFGAILLIAGAINRLLYVGDFLAAGERFSESPFYSSSPEQAVFKAELITILGTFITVVTWAAAGGARYSPGALFQAPKHVLSRLLTAIYIVSLVGLAGSSTLPAVAETLGQLLPTLIGLGMAAAFFLSLVTRRSSVSRIAVVIALCSPFVYFALGTGMKENVIITMMPAAYMCWMASRNIVFRIGLIGVGGVGAALLTLYVSQYREDAWKYHRQISVGTAVTQFTETTASRGALDASVEGLKGFLARSNASASRGWAISLADDYGKEPGLVFAPMLYVFVPRVLWPGKPAIRQGWEYSGIVFGQRFISWSESSTAAGLYTGLYLGFGWSAVIAGAICLGLTMAGMLKIAWHIGGGVLVGLFGFSMLPYTIRLDETWTVGALSGPVIGFIYVVAVFLFFRTLFGVRASLAHRPTGAAASRFLPTAISTL